MTQDPVIDALVEQVGCYRKLAKLAELQHEHVRQSRTEQLLEVLKSRQEVLNQVSACEQTVGPVKRQWGDYLAKLDSPDRQRAETLLAETRQLLEQITAADKSDVMVLQQRKLNVGRQINQASAARQLNRNYAAAAYGARAPGMDIKQ
jgi:hypothetical protein